MRRYKIERPTRSVGGAARHSQILDLQIAPRRNFAVGLLPAASLSASGFEFSQYLGRSSVTVRVDAITPEACGFKRLIDVIREKFCPSEKHGDFLPGRSSSWVMRHTNRHNGKLVKSRLSIRRHDTNAVCMRVALPKCP